jgi:CelD/BcsL family acetyltransferase involved in cellulose biosynthesis
MRTGLGKRSSQGKVRFRFVDGLDPLDGDWLRLATRATNIFGTWEWSSIWQRHFQPGGQTLTTVFSRDTDVIAAVPLYLSRSRLARVVKVVGDGVGDELGPACRQEDRAEVAGALRQALRDMPWVWDIFLGERFPRDDAWTDVLGGKPVRSWPSPVLRFHCADWNEFLRSRSGNQRRQISRFERRLHSDYRVHYRLSDDPDRLNTDLDLLFTLHRARWKGTSSAFAAHEPFHREFAACALERGWLRLWFMELDGTAVAAWYGFRFGGVEFAYQSGRDLSLDARSIGFVLLVHSMREALHDGVYEYRFLRGGETYKDRFANEDRGAVTIGVARNILGAAALGSASRLSRSPLARTTFRTIFRRHAGLTPSRTREDHSPNGRERPG